MSQFTSAPRSNTSRNSSPTLSMSSTSWTTFLWTYQAHDFMKHAKLDIFWSMPNKWSTPFHKAQQARKHAKFIEQVGMSSAPITWARKDASMLSTQHARMPFSRLNLDILFAFNIKKARLLSSYLHFWYFDFRL